MSPAGWKAVIVDDERLARNKLRQMLAAHPQIEIVGEADSVREAVNVVKQWQPSVVFLDIQMPGEYGFELLNKTTVPFKTIFITAFDEYAIRAFEVNALDYLLKPVTFERLAQAVERLSLPAAESEQVNLTLAYDDHLLLTVGDRSRFIKVSIIKYICAAGVYSEVHTADGGTALMSRALNEWEARLPAKHFIRIHRQTIINVEFVKHIKKWFNYSYQVEIVDTPEPFVMSRRYAARLKKAMG